MTECDATRRQFLRTAGAAGVAGLAGLAGCSAEPTDRSTPTATATETAASGGTTTGEPTPSMADTLVVATYPPFVDAPSTSPGAWLKRRFEADFDATLVYQTPDSELNYYLERAIQGVDFEADVYLGLDVNGLIRLDSERGSGQFTEPMFADASNVEGIDRVKESLLFDPRGRAIPFNTSYVAVVWNATMEGGEFVAPETFDGLVKEAYRDDLITQNPTTSTTGTQFLLHTIAAKGADGYLDYWRSLKANDVTVLGTWSDAYSAYQSGEAPMVVSYSTDQVYAHRSGQDLSKHQIRFLDDQGYARPGGMARFRASNAPRLAERFMEFVLRPEIQAGIAKRNVALPAVDDAPLPDDYEQYAKVPPEPVSFTYEELKGNLGAWKDEWQRMYASG